MSQLVNGDNRKRCSMIKTYSFTTDDDETEAKSTVFTIPNGHEALLSPNISSSTKKIRREDSTENKNQIRQRKSQQPKQNSIGTGHPSKAKPFWFQKQIFFNSLKMLGFFLILYVIWVKRELWINRFLVSNTRIRHLNNSKTLTEDTEAATSSSSLSKEDTTIPDQSAKLNLKTRRIKMNFNQEPSKKPSLLRNNSSSKSTVHLSTYDHIIKQLQENLKSHVRQRDFYKILSKATGLTKNQVDRFIFQNDHQVLTLQTFLSLLDLFDLMVYIIPK